MKQIDEIVRSVPEDRNKGVDSKNMAGLKGMLEEASEMFHLPSYSVTVYKDGIYSHIFAGNSDIDKKVPADSDTLYAIGSCTKSFTAGAICTLVDRGMMGLDDRIRDHIPEFEMMDSYVSEHMTVRDMLCHRSGLGGHDFSWYARLESLTQEKVIEMFRYLPVTQPFRYKWQYSNHMFALAGYLIERVSGRRWEDVVKENILDPLGIERVALSTSEAKEKDNCAVPYIYSEGSNGYTDMPHADIGVMGSAGCLYMSSGDLAKWDVLLLSGGSYEGKQIISAALCQQMLSPQIYRDNGIIPPLKGASINRAYGLGLEMEIFRGHRMVYHSGHIDGFVANQCLLPDNDFACTVLTNLGGHSCSAIMNYIIVDYFMGKSKNWLKEIAAFLKAAEEEQIAMIEQTQAVKPVNAPCPVSFDAVEGTYSHPGYGTVTVKKGKDKMLLTFGTHTFGAVHYAHQYFYVEPTELTPNTYLPLNIDVDIQGKFNGFEVAFDSGREEKIRFARQ